MNESDAELCALLGIDAAELARRRTDGVMPQPRTTLTDTADMIAAVQAFETALPGWWWTLGHCSLTRDASCGPDFRVLGKDHPHVTAFDGGFHDDNPGTLGNALRAVLAQAVAAIAEKDCAA